MAMRRNTRRRFPVSRRQYVWIPYSEELVPAGTDRVRGSDVTTNFEAQTGRRLYGATVRRVYGNVMLASASYTGTSDFQLSWGIGAFQETIQAADLPNLQSDAAKWWVLRSKFIIGPGAAGTPVIPNTNAFYDFNIKLARRLQGMNEHIMFAAMLDATATGGFTVRIAGRMLFELHG